MSQEAPAINYYPDIEPEWVRHARNHVGPCPELDLSVRTHILRHEATVRVLGFLERKQMQVKSLAAIGLGFNDDLLKQSYLPYMLAAYLEGKRVDYKMTLFDINPEIITDIKRRKFVYTAIDHYLDDNSFNKERAWKIYLVQTHQTDRLVCKPEPDLLAARSDNLLQLHEIYQAAIPESFSLKLKNGKIQMINGDISDDRLPSFGEFDLVDCRFLLIHLEKERQQVALANLVQAVKPGGHLYLNDRCLTGHPPATRPLFRQMGGWLTTEMLSQLGLTIVPEMTDLPESTEFKSESADVLLSKSK